MKPLARTVLPVALLLLVPVTALVALSLAGAMREPLPGLPDAGTLTRWVLPAARAVHDAAATVTIGFLAVAATVLPQDPGTPGSLGRAGARAMLLAAIAGSVWTVAGTVVLTLSYADVAGTDPLGPGASADAVMSFVLDLALGRSLAVNVLLAAAAATGAWLATRTTTAGVCTVLALAALLPLTVTAHGASNHEDAVNLLALHLIGATVWVGGLAAMYFLRRHLNGDLAVAVRRYSRLAGWCFILVLVSGTASALLRLDGPAALGSAYGVLLLLKSAALLLLGAAGWLHRARAIPALERDPHNKAVFARVAGVELVLMAATVGLAVALGRTSPFATSPVRSTAESLLGSALPPGLGPAQWFTQWHPDVVWLPAAVLLAGGYLAAVIRWSRSTGPWPHLRTLSWLLGCAFLAWATSGAPAAYGRLLPGMHVLGEMIIGLTVPVLLLLGGPGILAGGTLPRRSDGSRGLREWAAVFLRSGAVRWICRPVPAVALYAAFVTGYYFTPVLQLSLSNNPFRLAAMAVALCVGLNLAAALLQSAAQRKSTARRIVPWALAAAAAVHAGSGIAVMAGAMQAGDWYVYIQSLWSFSPTAQQRTAGEVLWGSALLPLLALGVAVLGPDSGPQTAPARPAARAKADHPA
ncbi:bifunctional copper resistance protein CopD/cytochrome c oxidase assembly protein [Pseudarthrobacter cellobiosi]|uniref:bifunctional copper resistance protein CopD/cytochrome c oxidase assembly protein n=1 Tax=Pseudarthrobacter cellobiosi TaxID=2953654 RepID=UPI00208F0E88|nr:bifunctional copper resistance protein CopD/cytochrome c oxidase assembly protein [Pseudarthrobacter sp. HLT1-5]MCO4254482.1 bifunctional copper resistance protein CopD/cytochrome c oxidase assembly protein [Pseudarthrobacter sp. HLT1-5]